MYYERMKFEWDTKKASENLKKHKVSFDEATTVFYDPLAKIANDPDHSNDENRFLMIASNHMGWLLFQLRLVSCPNHHHC